jgi:hypothetical protein
MNRSTIRSKGREVAGNSTERSIPSLQSQHKRNQTWQDARVTGAKNHQIHSRNQGYHEHRQECSKRAKNRTKLCGGSSVPFQLTHLVKETVISSIKLATGVKQPDTQNVFSYLGAYRETNRLRAEGTVDESEAGVRAEETAKPRPSTLQLPEAKAKGRSEQIDTPEPSSH